MTGGKVLGLLVSGSLMSIVVMTYLDYGTTMIPGTVDYKACEAIKPVPGFMDRKKYYYRAENKRWYPCWNR